MMRLLALALAGAMSAACAPVRDHAYPTVKILAGNGHGSGTHLGNGLVLTAQHVIDGSKEVTIETALRKKVKATVLWGSPQYDVALVLTADALPAHTREIDCRPLRVGDKIEAVGNPMDQDFVHSFGRVASTTRQGGKTPYDMPFVSYVMADIKVSPGMSGGPILGKNGKIVGITVAMQGQRIGFGGFIPLGFSIIVPSSAVCTLLGRA